MSSSAKVRVLHLLVPLQIGELSHGLLHTLGRRTLKLWTLELTRW